MSNSEEASTLQSLISALTPLDDATRLRLLKTIITFFDLKEAKIDPSENFNYPTQRPSDSRGSDQPSPTFSPVGTFSNRPNISPKEFLLDKEPATETERVVCLAYYLTHYRDTPHFKTLDISKLNTEAAQIKFSNAAVPVDSATRAGFLVQATKGNKQISALGEKFVTALPNREAAKEVRSKIKSRRTKKSGRISASQNISSEDE